MHEQDIQPLIEVSEEMLKFKDISNRNSLNDKLITEIITDVYEHIFEKRRINLNLKNLIEAYHRNNGDDTNEILTFITGIHDLISKFSKISFSDKNVLAKELEKIGIKQSIIEVICGLMFESNNTSKKLNSYNKLKSLDWNIKIGISNNEISRNFIPTIDMIITKEDGATNKIKISLEQFHHLRFKTALLLKDLHDIEQSRFLKLISTDE